MNYKRILSGVILFPIMAAIFIFGNTYLVDILLSGIAIMSLYEFYKALKTKTHPIEIIGYIAAAMDCNNTYNTNEYCIKNNSSNYSNFYINFVPKDNNY